MKGLSFILVVLATGLFGCSHERYVVITGANQLDSHVGKVVTVRGQVSNTKWPTILGVYVLSNSPDLRGQFAEATGILEKWTLTQEAINATTAISGPIQTDGPGIKYRLFDPKTQTEAQVNKIK
jgi:hypothetical protein